MSDKFETIGKASYPAEDNPSGKQILEDVHFIYRKDETTSYSLTARTVEMQSRTTYLLLGYPELFPRIKPSSFGFWTFGLRGFIESQGEMQKICERIYSPSRAQPLFALDSCGYDRQKSRERRLSTDFLFVGNSLIKAKLIYCKENGHPHKVTYSRWGVKEGLKCWCKLFEDHSIEVEAITKKGNSLATLTDCPW